MRLRLRPEDHTSNRSHSPTGPPHQVSKPCVRRPCRYPAAGRPPPRRACARRRGEHCRDLDPHRGEEARVRSAHVPSLRRHPPSLLCGLGRASGRGTVARDGPAADHARGAVADEARRVAGGVARRQVGRLPGDGARLRREEGDAGPVDRPRRRLREGAPADVRPRRRGLAGVEPRQPANRVHGEARRRRGRAGVRPRFRRRRRSPPRHLVAARGARPRLEPGRDDDRLPERRLRGGDGPREQSQARRRAQGGEVEGPSLRVVSDPALGQVARRDADPRLRRPRGRRRAGPRPARGDEARGGGGVRGGRQRGLERRLAAGVRPGRPLPGDRGFRQPVVVGLRPNEHPSLRGVARRR